MTDALPFDPERIELTGKNLVEASAGTGKTHAVATLFRRLVVERGFEASSVLVVTFTEAATTELRERVRGELVRRSGELAEEAPVAEREKLRRALESIDEAPISTIHGFCQRVLAEYALKSGVSFDAELVPDLEELYDDVLYDFWNDRIVGAGPELVQALGGNEMSPGKLRRLQNELRRKPRVPLEPKPGPLDPLLSLVHDFESYARREATLRKERRGVLGFEDLLERVHEALNGAAGSELARTLRERFRAVLVDEFQDTDPTQAEIFQRVFGVGEHPMFLIGDPKQAIYSFRGADVFGYLAAKEGARRHGMGQNWRSDPGVIASVNAIFSRPNAFFMPGIEYQPVAPRPGARDLFEAAPGRSSAPLDIVFVKRSDDSSKPVPKPKAKMGVARLTAADIAELLKSGDRIGDRAVIESDIAVLTRTNVECFQVQDALREYGVHSVVIGDKSVFDSDEAGDLEAALGAVLEPGRASLLRPALATRILGEDADAISGMAADAPRLQGWLEKLRAWNALWIQRGFMRMFRALLAGTGAAERLLARPGGERRLTNLLHLVELLHNVEKAEHLGPAALVVWLGEQRTETSSARAEHAEIRLESDERAVRLLTVHKAKGLEFPIVYLPYLWAGSIFSAGFPLAYHDKNQNPVVDVTVPKNLRDKRKDPYQREAFAEELRVVYVALTRAKRRTTVFWGGFNYTGASPAAFLLFPPPEKERTTVPKNTRLKDESDASLLRTLRTLESSGAARVRELHWDFDTAPLERTSSEKKAFAALTVDRPVRTWQRVDSFSALTRHVVHAPDDDQAARDREEGADALVPAAPSGSGERIVLDGFPRGRVSGDFFHSVLETIDFENASGADVLEVAREKLEGFGLSRGMEPDAVDGHLAQALEAIRHLLDTPLGPAGGVRLRDVPKSRRFTELEFHLPVARGRELSAWLDRGALEATFRENPSAEVPATYAERVGRLGFAPLSGFLKGFVDLVFEHDGRFYVVDYKTNHLSDFCDEYDAERMTAAMAESHYFLQYHLYGLALCRFLARHQRGFDYERNFGGALYLFMKGMRPGKATGVFFEKPPLTRMRALDKAFGGSSW